MVNIEEIKYAIVALKNIEDDKKQIVHFRWYQFEPTELDFKKLRQDLTEVEGFGLVGQMDDVLLSLAPPAVVQHYIENFFKKQQEDSTTQADTQVESVQPVKVVKARKPKKSKATIVQDKKPTKKK